MNKLRIHPKMLKGERYKFGKVLKKCQNLRFFDILNKMKDSLYQECVKGGFYLSRAKLKHLPLISLEK